MTGFTKLLTASLAALVLGGGAALCQEQEEETPMVPALVTAPTPFIGISPCRIVDTRDANRPPGYGPPALPAGGPPRNFTLAGQCGIPSGAQAVSLNVTAVNPQGNGYLALYPQGGAQPGVSTLNFLDRTVANAAIVPLGVADGITVVAGVAGTDLLIDVNGYYRASAVDVHDVFTGLQAGNVTTTSLYNTGFGFGALAINTTGENDTGFGFGALTANTTGSNNTAFGAGALKSNTTGSNNSALGAGALQANTTGSDNVAVGSGALTANVTGNYNTAVGFQALGQSTGSVNTAAGAYAGYLLTAGQSNVYLASPGATSESLTLRIGDPAFHTRFFLGGVRGVTTLLPDAVPVFVDSTGKVGTLLSSIRYKEDVRDMGESSDGLRRLRPVTFRYKGQTESTRQYGLIAEEVERVFPELVVHDAEGNAQSVLYHELPAMLVNEWQKQQRELARQEEESRELLAQIDRGQEEARSRQGRIDALIARMTRLEGRHREGVAAATKLP